MNKIKINQTDLSLLNSKSGLRHIFSKKEWNLEKVIQQTKYETSYSALQVELIKLQNWVVNTKQKVVIIFEGRDAAGKGGAIRRITSAINPRHYRTLALPKPTPEEQGQWYFQRYINQLPKPGEIVFFDRSWYNRAMVEPVNGFCSQEEYELFMKQVNLMEEMIIASNTYLIKFYFSIAKEEQAKRFKAIKTNPLTRWKMTPVDEQAQALWEEYTNYKNKMFDTTNTTLAPWTIINANQSTSAVMEATKYILNAIPYK